VIRPWLIELIVNAAAVAVITSGLLPGIRIEGNHLPTLIVVAAIFAIVNIVIKPVLKLLTCPLIVLTLGAIILVIDGAMLLLTATLSDIFALLVGGRLVIDGLLWAIVGALIMGIVEAALTWVFERQEKRDHRVIATSRPRQALLSGDRAQADAQFDALLTDDSPRRTRGAEGDPFDFYDSDSGKPKR